MDLRGIQQPIQPECLQDLENVELLSPDDLDIIDEKRSLRQKIAELERADSGNDG